MEKNKIGKYIKYAIGEILLVVIGILIALQINNWNDFRKARKAEAQAIFDLRFEFDKGIQLLLPILDQTRKAETANREYLQMLAQKNIPDEIKAREERPLLLFSSWDYDFKILTSLINTASIENMTNDSLKSLIFQWVDLTNNFKEIDQTYKNVRRDNLILYEMERIPYRLRMEDGQFVELFYSENEVQQMRSKIISELKYQNYLKLTLNLLYNLRIEAEKIVELYHSITEQMDKEIQK